MSQGFLIFTIVILPILCACLGFTVHYAIRPMVDSLLDALHEVARVASGGQSADSLARLEAEVAELRTEVRQLQAPPPAPLMLGADAESPRGVRESS